MGKYSLSVANYKHQTQKKTNSQNVLKNISNIHTHLNILMESRRL